MPNTQIFNSNVRAGGTFWLSWPNDDLAGSPITLPPGWAFVGGLSAWAEDSLMNFWCRRVYIPANESPGSRWVQVDGINAVEVNVLPPTGREVKRLPSGTEADVVAKALESFDVKLTEGGTYVWDEFIPVPDGAIIYARGATVYQDATYANGVCFAPLGGFEVRGGKWCGQGNQVFAARTPQSSWKPSRMIGLEMEGWGGSTGWTNGGVVWEGCKLRSSPLTLQPGDVAFRCEFTGRDQPAVRFGGSEPSRGFLLLDNLISGTQRGFIGHANTSNVSLLANHFRGVNRWQNNASEVILFEAGSGANIQIGGNTFVGCCGPDVSFSNENNAAWSNIQIGPHHSDTEGVAFDFIIKGGSLTGLKFGHVETAGQMRFSAESLAAVSGVSLSNVRWRVVPRSAGNQGDAVASRYDQRKLVLLGVDPAAFTFLTENNVPSNTAVLAGLPPVAVTTFDAA